MTPELRNKFEDTIKTGKVVLYPGIGADIRKRFAGVACIVRLRYHGDEGVVLHAIDTSDLHDIALEEIGYSDALYMPAWKRLDE